MHIFRLILKRLLPPRTNAGIVNIRRRIYKALFVAITLNIFFGTTFYFAERTVQESLGFWDAIWWAMVTMTTVGYGDYYAQTPIGRYAISYPCMLVGIGLVGYLISSLVESMVARMQRFRRGEMKINFSKHIILCNCFSVKKIVNLILELRDSADNKDCEYVLICDEFEELPDELGRMNIKFVKGSPAEEMILEQANLKECSGVFVLEKNHLNQESDAFSLAIVSMINMITENCQLRPKVVVEVVNKESIKSMKFSGVAGVVATEGISDRLIVQEFLYPGVYDIVQQIISNSIGSQFYIFKTRLKGFKFKEIQMKVLQHPEDIQVIGVIRGDEQLINPSKEYMVEQGDKLIVLAESKMNFTNIERDLIGS